MRFGSVREVKPHAILLEFSSLVLKTAAECVCVCAFNSKTKTKINTSSSICAPHTHITLFLLLLCINIIITCYKKCLWKQHTQIRFYATRARNVCVRVCAFVCVSCAPPCVSARATILVVSALSVMRGWTVLGAPSAFTPYIVAFIKQTSKHYTSALLIRSTTTEKKMRMRAIIEHTTREGEIARAHTQS